MPFIALGPFPLAGALAGRGCPVVGPFLGAFAAGFAVGDDGRRRDGEGA